VKRVVVLGRGVAGMSTVAAQPGMLTGLPVIELDKCFWSSDLTPLSFCIAADARPPLVGLIVNLAVMSGRSIRLLQLP
jgi:hypothetical protein